VRDARLVIALGGNAIAPAGTGGTAAEQTANIGRAIEPIADLIVAGTEVVLTHGNGPQVGNLLLKNELAADIVPPMPLDWCVAQTQATIGFTVVTALETALRRRGHDRHVMAVVSRVRVDPDDPAFAQPTKPIGRWRPDGTRRLVPSPEPLELLDAAVIDIALANGITVVAAGGGGVPMVATPDGGLRGVEAVIDKDRAAELLARTVGAGRLVVLTDVPAVMTGFGSDAAAPIGRIRAAELAALLDDDRFPAGSMGPKVEAAVRFVERTGGTAAIGALDDLAAVVAGDVGTQVVP
jgi:carbamate kinase